MLCSKCHKEIELEKEIQTEGSMVCKECSQKATAMCHGCSLPIFKHELIYQVSVGWNSDSESKTVNLIKCRPCYQEWLREARNGKDWWKLKMWINNISSFSIAYSLTLLGVLFAQDQKITTDGPFRTWLLFSLLFSLILGQIATSPFIEWIIRRKKRKTILKIT